MISQESARAPLGSAEAHCPKLPGMYQYSEAPALTKHEGGTMTDKSLWRGVLIVVLSVVLAKPAEAQAGAAKIVSAGTIVGAIVGIVAAVVVTVVVIHESSKKRTITGCVSSGENGISARDEKDKRTYASGNTAGIRAGDRITLQGK
jgi:hypothetical protein